MSFILTAIEKLILINLTNRNEVIFFRNQLVEQETFLFDYHQTNHNMFCDCREIERILSLFNLIINYLDQLINNNDF